MSIASGAGRALAAALLFILPPWVGSARADEAASREQALARGVDRASLIQLALERNPGLKAQAEHIRAERASSIAEGRLPDPEVMFQVWQVPFSHPLSWGDSQMVMAGVTQSFPAPGSLSARSEARSRTADAEEAMLADRARDLVRDVQHAYADLVEATLRHGAHVDHRAVADRIVTVSRAREAAGGTLDDVVQAELDLARLDADITTEAASIVRARARLNGLLARPYDAPLGPPVAEDPMTFDVPPESLFGLARRDRPDLRAASARALSADALLVAARREATWPSFSVGAYYFAPTSLMPFNGYGLSLSMTLPWLWGGARPRREAEGFDAEAARYQAEDARLHVSVDVGTSAATARAAAERLRVLRDGALPAAKRALEATFASYRSGKGDLLGVLRSERSLVDTEMDIVMARASLDHAVADLDWAVGRPLPRAPLAPAAGANP